MDYAPLVFGLWIGCSYGLLDPGKPVSTDDKYVPYPSVLKTVKYWEPVLGALIFPDLYGDYFLLSFRINTKYYICRKLPDDPVFPLAY